MNTSSMECTLDCYRACQAWTALDVLGYGFAWVLVTMGFAGVAIVFAHFISKYGP